MSDNVAKLAIPESETPAAKISRLAKDIWAAYEYAKTEAEDYRQRNAELGSRISELEEAVRWIPVSERLPEIIEKDGEVNVVFTKYKPEFVPDCGSVYSTSNTAYMTAHPGFYESWMYPPEEGAS